MNSQPAMDAATLEAIEANSERVLVALDASRHSMAALQAAAELAALMRAELLGVFVEDINLVRLSGIPISREVSTFSVESRTIDNRAVQRMFQVLQERMRRALEQTATRAQVKWSFQVSRGGVTAELLAAAQNALVLSMGCPRKVASRPLGSTTESVLQLGTRPVLIPGRRAKSASAADYPVNIVYTGTESSERALHLAARIARHTRGQITVFMWQESPLSMTEEEALYTHIEEVLAPRPFHMISLIGQQEDDLPRLLQKGHTGVFVAPGELVSKLCAMDYPVLIVP